MTQIKKNLFPVLALILFVICFYHSFASIIKKWNGFKKITHMLFHRANRCLYDLAKTNKKL